MRGAADDDYSGRDASRLYCNLCHLDWLFGCEYTLRLTLKRSDLGVSFRGGERVDYCPD